MARKIAGILAMFLGMLEFGHHSICATLLWEDQFDGTTWTAHWSNGNGAGHLTGEGIAVLDTAMAQNSVESYNLDNEKVYTFRIRGRFVNPGRSDDCNFGSIEGKNETSANDPPFVEIYGHPSPMVRMHDGTPAPNTHDEWILAANSWEDFHVYEFILSATRQKVYIDGIMVAVKEYDLRYDKNGYATSEKLNYHRVRMLGKSTAPVEVDFVQVYAGDIQESAGSLLWEDDFDGSN
jgi:hypothetical protein